MAILEWLESLSSSAGAGVIVPVGLFALSVAIFAYAVFNLSRLMSVRNVLGVDLSGLRRRAAEGRKLFWLLYGFGYLVSYGVIFPTLAYVWFWVLVVLLGFMYNTKAPEELLFISAAILSAVRVTSYHSPGLAQDIAKILPFGMLGIFLINLGDFDYGKSLALLEQAGTQEELAFYYWLYLVCQEFALRVTQPTILGIYNFVRARIGLLANRAAKRWRSARESVIEELEALETPEQSGEQP